MMFNLLSKALGLYVAVLFASCGGDNSSVINENCDHATEVADGKYQSVSRTLDPKFPLAVAQSEVSMFIDKSKKVVEISYLDDGKMTVQKWRIK